MFDSGRMAQNIVHGAVDKMDLYGDRQNNRRQTVIDERRARDKAAYDRYRARDEAIFHENQARKNSGAYAGYQAANRANKY